jgi:hypothetical protein
MSRIGTQIKKMLGAWPLKSELSSGRRTWLRNAGITAAAAVAASCVSPTGIDKITQQPPTTVPPIPGATGVITEDTSTPIPMAKTGEVFIIEAGGEATGFGLPNITQPLLAEKVEAMQKALAEVSPDSIVYAKRGMQAQYQKATNDENSPWVVSLTGYPSELDLNGLSAKILKVESKIGGAVYLADSYTDSQGNPIPAKKVIMPGSVVAPPGFLPTGMAVVQKEPGGPVFAALWDGNNNPVVDSMIQLKIVEMMDFGGYVKYVPDSDNKKIRLEVYAKDGTLMQIFDPNTNEWKLAEVQPTVVPTEAAVETLYKSEKYPWAGGFDLTKAEIEGLGQFTLRTTIKDSLGRSGADAIMDLIFTGFGLQTNQTKEQFEADLKANGYKKEVLFFKASQTNKTLLAPKRVVIDFSKPIKIELTDVVPDESEVLSAGNTNSNFGYDWQAVKVDSEGQLTFISKKTKQQWMIEKWDGKWEGLLYDVVLSMAIIAELPKLNGIAETNKIIGDRLLVLRVVRAFSGDPNTDIKFPFDRALLFGEVSSNQELIDICPIQFESVNK